METWLTETFPSVALSDGEIHIWCADLKDVDTAAFSWRLPPKEKERSTRYHFERDRLQFATCRYLLRTLLHRYSGIPPESIEFEYGAHGKPSLECGGHRPPIAFNISHSGGMALLAFARTDVGVDLELIRNEADLAETSSFFSEAERQDIWSRRRSERVATFFEYWTAKEACIKAHGGGLSIPLNEFTVRFLEDSRNAKVETHSFSALSNWKIQMLEVGAFFRAALAHSIPDCTLRQFRIPYANNTALSP
jgi:4'-phosphopantetheinyl transferase